MWTRAAFSPSSSGAHMLDAESECGYGDVGEACVLAFRGSGAHVFVSDSEISKNPRHFNNEIDFAGSEVLSQFHSVLQSVHLGRSVHGTVAR